MNQKIVNRNKWAEIIKFTEAKILQTGIKSAQLRTLLKQFQAQEGSRGTHAN